MSRPCPGHTSGTKREAVYVYSLGDHRGELGLVSAHHLLDLRQQHHQLSCEDAAGLMQSCMLHTQSAQADIAKLALKQQPQASPQCALQALHPWQAS